MVTRWVGSFVLVISGFVMISVSFARDPSPLEGVRRVVFLGDSITYSGQYIAFVETALRLKDPGLRCEFLNLGLPSETVSGLTEPGHAGGEFLRPVLSERLDRILENTKPDLVVACYGMNDGIYYPFDEQRFRDYQNGLKSLRSRAHAQGCPVLHLTPPVFDPQPIRGRTLPAGLAEYPRPFEGYDTVLDRYSGWLLAQRSAGWDVADLHGPLTIVLNQRRIRDPDFTMATDGVHLDEVGHGIIAGVLLNHWGVPTSERPENANVEAILKGSENGRITLNRVRQKQSTLRDAWLHATGHKRPGMKPGLTLEQAGQQAETIDRELRDRLMSPTQPRP